MTYVVLPNSGQSLGVTRIPINTNFSLIQSVFDLNHLTYNNSGAGKHRMVQIPVVQAASPGTAAGEIALYTKTVSGNPELFFQPQSIAAAGADVRITVSNILPTSSNPTLSVGGVASAGMVTFLPGGFVMMSGQVATTSKNQTVTFSFAVSEINSVQMTQLGNVPNVAANFKILSVGISNASFTYETVSGSGTGNGFYYIVIAKV